MTQPLESADNPLPLANWNGVIQPLAEVRVPALDRAFLFGDAVYEVLRIYRGLPFQKVAHLQRLQRNLDKLDISTDVQRITARMDETIRRSGVMSGIAYIQVTRGAASVRTHRFPDPAPVPNELIYIAEFTDPYRETRRTGVPVITHPDWRWKRCDIKSVNLLANCLAAQAAHEADCPEALLVDDQNRLIEGSRTSLFGVRAGTILTAPLGENILPGITRQLMMELADRCEIPVCEETLYLNRLHEVDELFLTGTTTEILPIRSVDEQAVGTGHAGPISQRLIDAYQEFVLQFAANAPENDLL